MRLKLNIFRGAVSEPGTAWQRESGEKPWWHRLDSDQRHGGYEPPALPLSYGATPDMIHKIESLGKTIRVVAASLNSATGQRRGYGVNIAARARLARCCHLSAAARSAHGSSMR